jgi:outer membrane protein assembly factor BamB
MLARIALAVASLALAAAAEKPVGDWPQWRGPNRDGVSKETGLLDKWPAGGPQLIWEAKGIGDGFASVAVAGGRLYTQGNRGQDSMVIALDLERGTELWATRNGRAYKNGYGDGPRGTPTVDGETVYAIGGHGDLIAVEAASGNRSWSLNILEKFQADNIQWGISESPLIVRNLLICTPGGRDATLVALDKKSGNTVWTSKGLSDAAGYASAIAFTSAGVEQVVNLTARGQVGVALADGRPLWRYDRAANRIANVATPIYKEGHVFVTSGYDTGCGLVRLSAAGKGKVTAKEVYFNREIQNHHGGVVLVGNHVYGFSGNSSGILKCLDLRTGKVAWASRSVDKGSMVTADGRLYLLGENGSVGLAEANPKAYREISRFEVEHGRQKAWAHPVVAGGRLYLRTQDKVRAYAVSARAGAGD